MCARRPSEGRVAGNPSPVAVIPARVSQHHAGPGPEPARWRRTRRAATAPRSPAAGPADPQRVGEQVVRRAVVLAAQQQPVDVALAEPDRPGVGAARRAGPW